ncbi:MAG: nitroreductase [Lachnospiraceae bacterium]|nr:nitroreductase [Lachnospiraceae bacterium]
MRDSFYDMIFKRKSFHLFRGVGSDYITEDELKAIEEAYVSFEPLVPGIRTGIRIVPTKQVSFKRDPEYCILIYSEKKENYLMNVGYIGEQLDLYLVENHIGSLWYGIGKPDEPVWDGMDFVIMFSIHKVTDDSKYRKDMNRAERKDLEEIWKGDDLGIANIARFAPSACNSQPWYVENNNGLLTIYRMRKPGKVGIMPAAKVAYFNGIDIGIYLCFLELCLNHEKIGFHRQLFIDPGDESEKTKVAEYCLSKKIG